MRTTIVQSGRPSNKLSPRRDTKSTDTPPPVHARESVKLRTVGLMKPRGELRHVATNCQYPRSDHTNVAPLYPPQIAKVHQYPTSHRPQKQLFSPFAFGGVVFPRVAEQEPQQERRKPQKERTGCKKD